MRPEHTRVHHETLDKKRLGFLVFGRAEFADRRSGDLPADDGFRLTPVISPAGSCLMLCRRAVRRR